MLRSMSHANVANERLLSRGGRTGLSKRCQQITDLLRKEQVLKGYRVVIFPGGVRRGPTRLVNVSDNKQEKARLALKQPWNAEGGAR